MTTMWILVANATSALLWKSRGAGRELELERRFEHPEGRLKNRELTRDAEGRKATPGGQGSRPGPPPGPLLPGRSKPRNSSARSSANFPPGFPPGSSTASSWPPRRVSWERSAELSTPAFRRG